MYAIKSINLHVLTKYKGGRKFFIFSFASLLLQLLVTYENQGQFQNLLVLRILKLSLKLKFDHDLAEKIKVKYNILIPK